MACASLWIRAVGLFGSAAAVVALLGGPAPARQPAPDRPPPAARLADDANEAGRRAEVLASSRWRRAMHELDEWLAAQPVYAAERVHRIKADLAAQVETMSSYELEYLLDRIDAKLQVLDSPAARETREWLGRYLAVMADDRRAALLENVPNVLEMSADELSARLAELEAKREQVERSARKSERTRREFAAVVRADRQAAAAERATISRIRRDAPPFSPYRGQPVEDPPFATSFDSPTVVGVGPWNAFGDRALTAF